MEAPKCRRTPFWGKAARGRRRGSGCEGRPFQREARVPDVCESRQVGSLLSPLGQLGVSLTLTESRTRFGAFCSTAETQSEGPSLRTSCSWSIACSLKDRATPPLLPCPKTCSCHSVCPAYKPTRLQPCIPYAETQPGTVAKLCGCSKSTVWFPGDVFDNNVCVSMNTLLD